MKRPLLVIAALVASSCNESEASFQEKRDRKAIAEAMVDVRSKLKDPDSAQFGHVYVSPTSPAVVCGMVNARNSFGGYTGEQPFLVVMGEVHLADAAALSNERAGEFITLSRMYC